jgi:glycine/D-amino acid oxidase-like deaminating enzyme
MQSFDYLIVGQGLAGSLLAYELLEAGAKVMVIDNPAGPSSSKVAAGIFNPITGKRFVKTWLCDEIYPSLVQFYKNLEQKLKAKFLNESAIIRPIASIKDQNFLISLADDPQHSTYIEYLNSHPEIDSAVQKKYGLLSTKIGGWLNVPCFLEACKKYFISKQAYFTELFDYQLIEQFEKSIFYKNISAKSIVFCEGYGMVQNPFFNYLPFNAVKGEILDVEMEVKIGNNILMDGIFIVPNGGNKFKIGATYNWQDKTMEITEKGRDELLSKIVKLIKIDYKIINQAAGIRPATIDRRPFLGLHPCSNQMAVFNGLGTKGVSLGPYFAKHFTKFLLNNEQLMPDVNINRFSSLYLSSDY